MVSEARYGTRFVGALIDSADLACRFAFNYHRIIEHFLFQDREPDVSLMSGISYLIMGNGMACVAATARNDLLGTVVDLMQAWYTRSNEDQSLHLPTPGAANDESPESRSNRERGLSFKNKKGIHLFAHLRGLLLHKEIQQIIVSDPGLFLRVVQFLNLFVGMQAQTRELTDHIQYEVEWIKTFSLLGELAKTARELGECFTVADTPERLINALSIVAQRILLDISLLTNTLDPAENNPPSVHEVQNVLIPGSSYTLIDENCLEIEGFSFHHYLHYLFAELLKAVPTVIDFSSPTMRGLTFPELIEKFVLQPQTSRDADHVKLLLIENPMQSRCLSFVADYRNRRNVPNTSGSLEAQWEHDAEPILLLSRHAKPRANHRSGIPHPPTRSLPDRTRQIHDCLD